MIITLKMLKRARACGTEIFQELFGEQAEVTLENCYRAIQAGLDLNWVARNLFSPSAQETYAKAIEPVREAYAKAIESSSQEALAKTIVCAHDALEKAISQAFYEASKLM